MVSRWRASESNLALPDIAGIESPIAITMAGLAVIVGLGSSVVGASISDQRLLLYFGGSESSIVAASLFGRKDVLKRIPLCIGMDAWNTFHLTSYWYTSWRHSFFGGVNVLSDNYPLIGWTLIWIYLECVLLEWPSFGIGSKADVEKRV